MLSLQQDISIPEPQPHGNAIGIDVGINSFLATSAGELIPNPRFFEKGLTYHSAEPTKTLLNTRSAPVLWCLALRLDFSGLIGLRLRLSLFGFFKNLVNFVYFITKIIYTVMKANK